jgi:LysM repeat protein
MTAYLKGEEVRRLEELIIGNEEKIKKIENEIEELLSSDDWKTFLEMQRIREELKAKMKNKKSDFINSVSKIEIPLKRYKKFFENKILDDYIQISFDSILYEDPKGDFLMSILKDMKIGIIEGKMKLKDSDKFMAIIESLKENNAIGRIIEDYSRLSEELRKQEEKILSQRVSKRKNDLESESGRLKREIEELKNDKKIAEEKMKNIQASREQKIKELENLLYSVYGKKILLEVN